MRSGANSTSEPRRNSSASARAPAQPGVIAYRELSEEYEKTKKRIGKIDNEHRVTDDYVTLKAMLDADSHLWVGSCAPPATA